MQEKTNEPKCIRLTRDTSKEEWLDNGNLTPWISPEDLSVVFDKLQRYMLLEDQ